MSFKKLLAMATLVLVGIPSASHANVSYFLAGDSFFCTRLTKTDILRLAKEKLPTFSYDNGWDGGGLGCGSAGYGKLQLPNLPATTVKHLQTTFKDQLPMLGENLNGRKVLYVFVYNRKYDWKKHGIGIQYNENWVEETVSFGHKKSHVRLESFVGASGLMAAWRDSQTIAPLKTKIAKNAGNKPVVLDGEFQLLVIATQPKVSCDDYFAKKDGLRIIQITQKGRTDFIVKNGRWIETPRS